MHSTDPTFISATDTQRTLTYEDAVDALEEALLTGEATKNSPLRTRTDLPSGHLLYMPAQVGGFVGTKLASVSETNQERGLPRIQGLVVLADSDTLQPRFILDASGLTVLRTAALSALAVRHMSASDASKLVVFGAGPQAKGHIEAIRAVRPVREVVIVSRSPGPARDLVEWADKSGLTAMIGTQDMVSDAHIVACCTSSTAPLFDSELLPNSATVVAMGSHSPRAREIDAALVGRAFVAVESRNSAFAEAGDIILACEEGISYEKAVDAELADIVRVSPNLVARPRLFKGVGEAWADVVVASLAVRRLGLIDQQAESLPTAGCEKPTPVI